AAVGQNGHPAIVVFAHSILYTTEHETCCTPFRIRLMRTAGPSAAPAVFAVWTQAIQSEGDGTKGTVRTSFPGPGIIARRTEDPEYCGFWAPPGTTAEDRIRGAHSAH